MSRSQFFIDAVLLNTEYNVNKKMDIVINMSVLQEHIARHTGEVLYKCQFCTKTFNNNANKSKHRNRIHSQEYAMYLISQQKNCI